MKLTTLYRYEWVGDDSSDSCESDNCEWALDGSSDNADVRRRTGIFGAWYDPNLLSDNDKGRYCTLCKLLPVPTTAAGTKSYFTQKGEECFWEIAHLIGQCLYRVGRIERIEITVDIDEAPVVYLDQWQALLDEDFEPTIIDCKTMSVQKEDRRPSRAWMFGKKAKDKGEVA